MKKVLFILLLIIPVICNAQELSNGSFNGSCTGNGFNAPSCIKGWNSSHGSPTVLGNLNANKWAWLSTSREYNDGIFANYNFIIGKQYTVSFKIKTASTIDNLMGPIHFPKINVRATNELISSSAKKIQIASEESELIWSKNVFKNTNENWQTIKITFIPTKNSTQIWFFPSIENKSKLSNSDKLQMEIDDIEITPFDDTLISTIQEVNSDLSVPTENIYPNPAQRGQLTRVSIISKKVAEIVLINLNGENKKIKYMILDSKTIGFIFDFTISRGIYTLEITKNDGTIDAKKLIIE